MVDSPQRIQITHRIASVAALGGAGRGRTGVGSLLRIGGAPVDVKLQGFGYPERPTGGPDWSVQLQVKLLFPK
jgi:hypothetical protein